MSIRFAAPASLRSPRLPAEAVRRWQREPANDDDAPTGDDRLLRAALRHFAEHGLAAAQHARVRAEHAFFAGDRDAYLWWLSICRTLDRRLARELDATGSLSR